jgi:hypothetical protein
MNGSLPEVSVPKPCARSRLDRVVRVPRGNHGDILNGLFFARSQMGISLAFHMIFAVIGTALSLLMERSD